MDDCPASRLDALTKRDHTYQRIATAIYLLVLLAVNAVLLLAGTAAALSSGTQFALITSILISLVLFDASHGICEAVLSHIGKRRPCQAENYVTSGIPSASRVVIIVPVLLNSIAQVETILKTSRWNIQMANDSNVFLLLVYDFKDSKREELDESEQLVKRHFEKMLQEAAIDLSKKYGGCIHGIYRHRQYSKAERLWMGRERKRGKLQLVNALIEGLPTDEQFDATDGALMLLRRTKYVLVLDEDSKLTPDTIQHMVGFMDHPSNRPVFRDGLIEKGHALVCCQSIVEASSLVHWKMSRAICGSRAEPGNVARPSYEFFYDWFGASKYIGKGLYDVKAYRLACDRNIPGGLILSHDTIESAYVKAGFSPHGAITDRFPSSHKAILARTARWMRGDIQNFYYLVRKLWREDAFGTSRQLSIPGRLMLLQQLGSLLNAMFMLPLIVVLIFRGSPLLQLAIIIGITGIHSYTRFMQNVARDLKHRRPLRFWVSIYPGYVIRIHFSILYKVFLAPAMFLIAIEALAHATASIIRGRGLLRWDSAEAVESGVASFGAKNRLILSGALGLALIVALVVAGEASPLGYVIASAWGFIPMIDRIILREASNASDAR